MSFLIRRAVAAALGGGGGPPAGGTVFSIDLYTGNGATRDIVTGIDATAQDTMVWMKNRDNAYNNVLFDTLRGATKTLVSNESGAEFTDIGSLTAFNSDGFSSGTGNNTNRNGDNYVAWTFGKSPKFFDIIEYTGDGVAGREIPHSLGVQAGMCFVKGRTAASSWTVQHLDLGGEQYGFLNTNGAFLTNSSLWNDTSMSGSEVTLGASNNVNGNGNEYIMYVFAHDVAAEGVIQCGKYTGNGSPNGPTVTLGWTPRYIMIKSATGTRSWVILDTVRGMQLGGSDAVLYADLANAELQLPFVDLTPTGFKIAGNYNDINQSGQTYIYMAIREE